MKPKFRTWRRRQVGKLLLAGTAVLAAPAVIGAARPRVAIVGAGPGGLVAARRLISDFPGIDVTIIEANRHYFTPFFANRFLGGLSPRSRFSFGYAALQKNSKVRFVHGYATTIDADKKWVQLVSGARVAFDRLILSPGVSMVPNGIGGYDAHAAETMPHAYLETKATQWVNLKRRISAMDDGGLIVITVPKRPYRCHPAPYERATLLSAYLKRQKPKSKVLLLDANDSFPLMEIMEPFWEEHFGDSLEWVPGEFGGAVMDVDVKARTIKTTDGGHKPDVANIIPPQRAGNIAAAHDLADDSGWCTVNAETFESRRVPHIHIVGDAIDPGDIPRSAFAASRQAEIAAIAVGNALTGQDRPAPPLTNSCFFLLSPKAGLHVSGAYTVKGGHITGVKGSASQPDEGAGIRAETAARAEQWFQTLTGRMFG